MQVKNSGEVDEVPWEHDQGKFLIMAVGDLICVIGNFLSPELSFNFVR